VRSLRHEKDGHGLGVWGGGGDLQNDPRRMRRASRWEKRRQALDWGGMLRESNGPGAKAMRVDRHAGGGKKTISLRQSISMLVGRREVEKGGEAKGEAAVTI